MHIAFSGHFWDQPRTGSGQYLRHLWAALDEVCPPQDRLTLLLPHDVQGDDVPVTGRASVIRGGRFPLIGGRSGRLDKTLWEIDSVARAARGAGADVLHIPYLSAPLLGGRQLKLMVTAHDMIPWVLPGYAGSLSMRLYLRIAAASVRRAHMILADSDASRHDVIRVLGVQPGRVHTVYLGMEPHPEHTEAQKKEVRARFNLPDSYAFYLGGFDRRKNVPLLLQAWRDALPNLDGGTAPVLAIGGGVPDPGGVFPDVRGYAAQLGLDEGAVRFLGRVSEEDKPLLMAAARVFVYPSAYEGFGLDPLEAMSVGCPVVSSSGGSLVEVVGDAGVLVSPGDRAALAEGIVRVWGDADLRARLSGMGRERAKTFTWQRTAERTAALYRSRRLV